MSTTLKDFLRTDMATTVVSMLYLSCYQLCWHSFIHSYGCMYWYWSLFWTNLTTAQVFQSSHQSVSMCVYM